MLGANLYVKNLEDDVDDEQLRTQFSRFGTIISSRVMRDVHGRSRCFGFVCFDSADAASQAQKEMQSAPYTHTHYSYSARALLDKDEILYAVLSFALAFALALAFLFPYPYPYPYTLSVIFPRTTY